MKMVLLYTTGVCLWVSLLLFTSYRFTVQTACHHDFNFKICYFLKLLLSIIISKK